MYIGNRLLLCCGLLALGAVFSKGENVDFSNLMTRVILENSNSKVRTLTDDVSPEIDSTEHGVKPGPKKTSCPCGRANRVTGRIVGGREYRQFEYPFLAAISYSTRPLSPHCGGAIITQKHILTAAHCTEKAINGITLFVIIAEHDRGRTPGAYTVPVKRFIQHPDYNTNTLHNDISLLGVENPLIMTGAVAAACMPLPGLDLTGKYIRVVGWGANRFKGPMTARPQKVDLRVTDSKTCYNHWPINVVKSPVSQICTMSKKRTTCQGDSGGPVVWLDPETNMYTLVGLVSAGPACNDEKPSVHTSVVRYLPWIRKSLAELNPGQNVCTKV